MRHGFMESGGGPGVDLARVNGASLER
jgi:hypothetical protein